MNTLFISRKLLKQSLVVMTSMAFACGAVFAADVSTSAAGNDKTMADDNWKVSSAKECNVDPAVPNSEPEPQCHAINTRA